jgi:predicted homoserine dehydrogenase-like protein
MSKNTTKRKKEFGVIGLGRMGGDLAHQAIEVLGEALIAVPEAGALKKGRNLHR